MAYATVAELQRRIGKETGSTADELDAMEQMLEAAAQEIDWDLGYTAENPAPTPPPPIVVDVNLNRAAELWRLSKSTFGVLPQVPADVGPVFAPRDTWHRHHLRLSPLRAHAGIA